MGTVTTMVEHNTKNKYNAKIFMSNTDFYYMNNTFDGANGSRSPKCTVDEFLTDR